MQKTFDPEGLSNKQVTKISSPNHEHKSDHSINESDQSHNQELFEKRESIHVRLFIN